jgi:GNAT superfamily N-acetyltransferase
MKALSIRRATPADADVIAAFNAALAVESEARRLDARVVASGVRRLLSDPTLGVYYVAECGGSVVGQLLITFEFSDWRDGMFWWIQSVYVLPDQRRHGVYRALHEHVAGAARRDGRVCGLRLYVDRRNARAQEVYRRLGLEPAGYELYEIDWRAPAAAAERDAPPWQGGDRGGLSRP